MLVEETCYNCENSGITREHVIPFFILCNAEEGLFAPCCNNCQEKLNWLDDNASHYFRVFNNTGNVDEQNIAFRQLVFKKGSATSLRFFSNTNNDNGEKIEFTGDIVVDENLLMRFIHKICVGVTYRIYGKLEDTYSIHIFNNFSKLGGYCVYNSPNDKSYSEEQTKKIEEARDKMYEHFKNKTINIYGLQFYKTHNAKVLYTKKRVHDAYWIDIVLYNKFKILCAITNTSLIANSSLNMAYAVFPIRIDLNELDKYREQNKLVKKGDNPSRLYFPKIMDNEIREFFREKLLTSGLSVTDDEFEILFERFLTFFENKVATEELWNKRLNDFFRENFKDGRLYLV